MDFNTILAIIHTLSMAERPLREYEVMLHEAMCNFVATKMRQFNLAAESEYEKELRESEGKDPPEADGPAKT